MRYYNDFTHRKKTFYKKECSYLFVCAVGDNIIAHCLLLDESDIQQVITVHGRMFPSHQPMAVFTFSKLEAYLLACNFNTKRLTLSNYVIQQNQTSVFAYASATGMTPVYLSVQHDLFMPVLQQTASEELIGYLVNSNYFGLIQKMFMYEQSS